MVKQLNTMVEQEYIDAFNRAAAERGWSKADTMRYAISTLAREEAPPGLPPVEMCKQIYQPALDEIREHLAQENVREAAEVVNRISDGSLRNFCVYLAMTVDALERMLGRYAAENAGRQLVGMN